MILFGSVLPVSFAAGSQTQPSSSLPVLTTVAQIRALTHDQANRHYPIHLRATVTFYQWDLENFFVEDRTGGIYVNDFKRNEAFVPGDLLDITGVTEAPDFAPQIAGQAHFQLLGRVPLPGARPATVDEMLSTRDDSQWVKIEGIVRETSRDHDGNLTLQIGAPGGELPVYVLDSQNIDPTKLVDAKIRVVGVCVSFFNQKNQLNGVGMDAPSPKQVTVEEPAPRDPFSVPLRRISSVLSFASQGVPEHRVKVEGTVTLVRPLGVFIQNGSEGLYLPKAASAGLTPGERVQAVGFADVGDYTPVLTHALFRRIGFAPVPPPLKTSAAQAMVGAFDTLRVRMEGTLRNVRWSGGETVLAVEDGNVLFGVRLASARADRALSSLPPGSRLQVTGVCSVHVDRNRNPLSFEILLASPAGIVILARPSWWTLRHSLLVFELLMAVVLAVLVWVAVLKRRMNQQTVAIRRHRESEAALQERIAYITKASNDIVWDWDLRTDVLSLSDGADDVFGYSGESGARTMRAALSRIHPDDRQRINLGLREFLGSKTDKWSCEHRYLRASGSYAYVMNRAYMIRDEGGHPVRVIGAMVDVSAQKQTEAELAHERNLMRTLIDTVPDFVYVKDRKSRFLLANAAVARVMRARSCEGLLGKTDFDFYPEEMAQAFFSDDQQVVNSGKPLVNREERGLTAEGAPAWILTTKVPLRDPDGVVTGLVGLGRDITSRKEAEEEIKTAREAAEAASRAKSEFLANMSHEIRTPMNGVLGMTELLLESGLSREQQDYAGMVKSSAESLLTIINDILDFSKIEAGRLELEPIEFNLRDSVAATVKTLAWRAQDKGLELTYEFQPEAPQKVVGDPGRLRQVLINLIGNAIKFTERGEVGLEVAVESETPDQVLLHFVVRDTGIGIAEEKQKLVFDAFSQADGSTTRKFGGTGLGLTISRRLVEMMGGRIWLESRTGQGSSFHFTCRLGAVKTASEPEMAVPADVAGAHVLVVDDNATNRRVLGEMLSKWGMKPALAASGREALERLSEREDFCLILTDFNMPGMNGFAFVERLREATAATSDAKVILLTSAGQRGDARRCQELGVAAYLTKPVSQSELLDTVVRVLGAPQSHAESAPLITRHTLREGKRRLRVLLAEDNPVNQTLASRLLEKQGHSVTVSANGREALAALDKQSFDLVFMDVQMPEMDGFEATAAIRARERTTGSHLTIIAMTAHAMQGDREQCLAVGMDGYISKPINVQELCKLLTSLPPSTREHEGVAV